VLFVHGWHHNAHDNDCNVQEARQMVRIASQQFDAAVKAHKFVRQRRVFGIYVGWRGESVNAAALRYTTVVDRRDTAEKVAKGSVRQLLADLHEQQLIAQAAASARETEADRAARMHTTVVGHSFGGLIVFNALSQRLISDLTARADDACTPGGAQGVSRPWPDGVVLINPAFEATRFEPLNRLADRAAGCGYAAPHPLLTVITADNDRWTGRVFTAGRRVLTLFEAYDDSTPQSGGPERNANCARSASSIVIERIGCVCGRTAPAHTRPFPQRSRPFPRPTRAPCRRGRFGSSVPRRTSWMGTTASCMRASGRRYRNRTCCIGWWRHTSIQECRLGVEHLRRMAVTRSAILRRGITKRQGHLRTLVTASEADCLSVSAQGLRHGAVHSETAASETLSWPATVTK